MGGLELILIYELEAISSWRKVKEQRLDELSVAVNAYQILYGKSRETRLERTL